MRRWVVASLLLLALTPLAAAQVPEPPDPSEVVDQACALLPVDVPVCPQQEPPGPAPQQPEEHEHEAPPAPPASPQSAQQLVDEAREDVQGVVEDPASAPDRVASLVATLVQFVKDLLDVPAQGAHALDARRAAVADSLHGALATTKDAVTHAVDAAKAKLADLFHKDAPVTTPVRDAPVRAPKVDDATSLLDGVLQRVPSPMAR